MYRLDYGIWNIYLTIAWIWLNTPPGFTCFIDSSWRFNCMVPHIQTQCESRKMYFIIFSLRLSYHASGPLTGILKQLLGFWWQISLLGLGLAVANVSHEVALSSWQVNFISPLHVIGLSLTLRTRCRYWTTGSLKIAQNEILWGQNINCLFCIPIVTGFYFTAFANWSHYKNTHP